MTPFSGTYFKMWRIKTPWSNRLLMRWECIYYIFFFLSFCCTAMWNLFKVRSVGTFLTASVPVSLIRCGLINKRTVSHFWSLTRWPDARMCILSDAAIKKYRNTCHSSFPCFQPSYLRALKSFFFFIFLSQQKYSCLTLCSHTPAALRK